MLPEPYPDSVAEHRIDQRRLPDRNPGAVAPGDTEQENPLWLVLCNRTGALSGGGDEAETAQLDKSIARDRRVDNHRLEMSLLHRRRDQYEGRNSGLLERKRMLLQQLSIRLANPKPVHHAIPVRAADLPRRIESGERLEHAGRDSERVAFDAVDHEADLSG